ncbi:MAG: sigma-54-dependent Fis family transcriptional regulator [bacterium]|nr:sigma-54-dependent Fis family transcriptional regulator [bacterium]
MSKILVVEDEKSMRDLLAMVLRKEGYDVETVESATEATDVVTGGDPFDLVVSDISMPGLSGLDLLRHCSQTRPDTAVILMTAYGTKQTAIDALNEGAAYYIEKPFDIDEMRAVVRKTIEQKMLVVENLDLKSQNRDLRAELRGQYEFQGLIGRSPRMQSIFRLIERVAGTGSTIMISGESGTGKELIAKAVHYNSGRGERPFVSINCGALPDELLESELFGHMKGSFTGATANKKGLFQVANGGTIFLDEIGETSPAMQIKLLRVLQERTIRPVGGTEEIEVEVRVITATNQDLEQMVSDKQFREDLYYRINVIAIRMPALRQKPEDIPALAEHFLDKYRSLVGKPISEGLSKGALECLESYDWPGNVRQLENVIERAVALEAAEEIQPESLPPEVRRGQSRTEELDIVLREGGIDLEQHLEELRRHYMLTAMERCDGVQTRAAELLGMTFRSFRYFAKKYGMSGRDSQGDSGAERQTAQSTELVGEPD